MLLPSPRRLFGPEMGPLTWLRDSFAEASSADATSVCFLGSDKQMATRCLGPMSSFYQGRSEGFWGVPNEKCLRHRSFWRELYGPSVGPEHYCVNENAVRDFKSSDGREGIQKCYDYQDCQSKGLETKESLHQRTVQASDPDYPNTVLFLTPDANKAALGMK